MSLKNPSLEALEKIATRYNLDLSREQLEVFKKFTDKTIVSYRKVDEMKPTIPLVKYSRAAGHRAIPKENPFNAWYWKVSIAGSEEGLLKGKRIAVKDNVSIAGVPMTNGTSLLEGYIPDIDATVVTRILDAGGEITGKAVCEHLSSSGASHTSDSGPVLNPYRPSHSAGGSSSGSAVLVAVGEVDMAIGADQGGSIRVPSAWCGVFGLKPTYGLVPYTGIFQVDRTLDHVGPMARSSEDLALLLEVIAGEDDWDPRQKGVIPRKYTEQLKLGIKGMRIGILKEGFDWESHSEQDVDQLVAEAAYSLSRAGATVEMVSVPMHRHGIDIWSVISTEGPFSLLMNGYSQGNNAKGYYQTDLMDSFYNTLKSSPNKVSDTVKFAMLMGQYMHDEYYGRYYGKAQNLTLGLKAAYDEALDRYDVLILPTVPVKATPIPASNAGTEEIIMRAYETVTNTAPFNLTGHPALNVPCGFSDGLPVGLMMVGQVGADDVLLRIAYAFEHLR